MWGPHVRTGTFNCLLFLVLLISLSKSTSGLFEDQAGKFDWHQKYFGRISFLFNDLNQPKRLIVGTGDNIVGAVNSNTGAVLYRHVLESNAKLLHLGSFGDKEVLSVSSSADQVKIRSFFSSNGVQSNEWTLKHHTNYATESQGLIYLVDTVSAFPSLSITTYDVVASENVDYSKAIKRNLKLQGTNTLIVPLDKLKLCEAGGAYLVCTNGNKVVTISLAAATAATKDLINDGEANEISVSTSKELTAVAIKGDGFVKIYKISQNQEQKDVPRLTPMEYPKSSYFTTLSQAKIDDTMFLFVTRLVTAHSIQVDAFTTTTLQKVESHSMQVASNILISSLALAKAYCHGSTCGLAGFTQDEVLFGSKLDADRDGHEVTWSRQESLASTLAVETVDYPSEAEQSWNPYSTQQGIFKSFISRVKYEIDTLITGDRFYTSNDDRFGVKKVIVFVTKVGKVIGMDGSSGQILYAFLLPEFSTFKDSSVFLSLQRQAKYAPLKPLASIVYPSSKSDSTILFPFNPIEGQHLDEPQTYPAILQAQMLLHGKQETNFLKPVLLLDKNNVVHTYPPRARDFSNIFFFVADTTEQAQLKGFTVTEDLATNTLRGKLLWTLGLGKSELIGVHGKLPCEKIHSQGRVLPDRSVSYKYMNPNLVAVVTAEPEVGNINVFLIDAVSGAVIHSFWHKKSRGPVHVVHSEHWIVYSLFNEKNRRYEVTSIELYEGHKQSNSTVFSSFAAPAIQPLVIKQSYIFPTKIEFMSYTRTDKGITNKDILLALPTGGILELPKFVMQPRLSAQHHQIHQDEDGVIHSVPYIPELPMPPDMIINYNQSVKRVRGIKTWPTRLESTCLVLVHGIDIYYTKVAPSKQFDVLKDDFDHLFITVVLTALCVGAYVTKRLSAKKQLEQAWR